MHPAWNPRRIVASHRSITGNSWFQRSKAGSLTMRTFLFFTSDSSKGCLTSIASSLFASYSEQITSAVVLFCFTSYWRNTQTHEYVFFWKRLKVSLTLWARYAYCYIGNNIGKVWNKSENVQINIIHYIIHCISKPQY